MKCLNFMLYLCFTLILLLTNNVQKSRFDFNLQNSLPILIIKSIPFWSLTMLKVPSKRLIFIYNFVASNSNFQWGVKLESRFKLIWFSLNKGHWVHWFNIAQLEAKSQIFGYCGRCERSLWFRFIVHLAHFVWFKKVKTLICFIWVK